MKREIKFRKDYKALVDGKVIIEKGQVLTLDEKEAKSFVKRGFADYIDNKGKQGEITLVPDGKGNLIKISRKVKRVSNGLSSGKKSSTKVSLYRPFTHKIMSTMIPNPYYDQEVAESVENALKSLKGFQYYKPTQRDVQFNEGTNKNVPAWCVCYLTKKYINSNYIDEAGYPTDTMIKRGATWYNTQLSKLRKSQVFDVSDYEFIDVSNLITTDKEI